MPVLRRVYGEVDDNTFFAFRDRAKREGLALADAFSAIVIAYGKGYHLVRPHQKPIHAKSENGFPSEARGA